VEANLGNRIKDGQRYLQYDNCVTIVNVPRYYGRAKKALLLMAESELHSVRLNCVAHG